MSNNLAQKEKFMLDESCSETSSIHVSSFIALGYQFIILTEKGSFYSHIIHINENEIFKHVLHDVMPGEHKYIKMNSASARAKISSLIKRLKLILERMAENDDTINIEKAMNIVNDTPWKFLRFKTPNEIKND